MPLRSFVLAALWLRNTCQESHHTHKIRGITGEPQKHESFLPRLSFLLPLPGVSTEEKSWRKATRVLNPPCWNSFPQEGRDKTEELCPKLSRRMPREERSDKKKSYSWPVSKTIPITTISYYPCLFNPLPLTASGTCDLPVTKRIRQKWQGT